MASNTVMDVESLGVDTAPVPCPVHYHNLIPLCMTECSGVYRRMDRSRDRRYAFSFLNVLHILTKLPESRQKEW